jgi:ribonuclease HI
MRTTIQAEARGSLALLNSLSPGIARDEEIFSEGFRESTNNRMELQACLRALENVRDVVSAMDIDYRFATWHLLPWGVESCS